MANTEPIFVDCVKCQSKLRVSIELLGKNVQCPKCGVHMKLFDPNQEIEEEQDPILATLKGGWSFLKKTLSAGASKAREVHEQSKETWNEAVKQQEIAKQHKAIKRRETARRREAIKQPEKVQAKHQESKPAVPASETRFPLPRFLGHWTTLQMGSYKVRNPMVYVVDTEPRDNYDASLLCTKAQVTDPRAEPHGTLGYWPQLSECKPHQLGNYLNWLSSGKNNPNVDIGYVFLFFYGLERRALVDDEDYREITRAVLNLLDVYHKNNSFRGYATRFLTHLAILGKIDLSIEVMEWFIGKRAPRTDDLLQSLLLGHLAKHQKPLPGEWAFLLTQQDERSQKSVVCEREQEKFKRLFLVRYEEKCGRSLIPQFGDREYRHHYRPASPTLTQGAPYLPVASCKSVRGWKQQFGKVVRIYNECIEDLRDYSREARKEGRSSIAAFGALPAELREEYAHPLQKTWDLLLEQHCPEEGDTLLPIGQLASMCGVDDRDKLTLPQSRKVAELVETFGLSIEPDSRFTRKGYRWMDHVAVAHLPEGQIVPDRRNFALASLLMPLAMHVSMADSTLDEEERTVISEFMQERFMLTQNETARVELQTSVYQKNTVQPSWFRSKLNQEFTEVQRRALARFLVMVAAASEGICSAEEKALKAVFRQALGLPEALVLDIAEELGFDLRTPYVTVQEAASVSDGEPIPVVAPAVLDFEKVRDIEIASQQAAELLLEMMGEEVPAEEGELSPVVSLPEPAIISEPESTSGPPVRLSGFYETLCRQSVWQECELSNLAKQHGTTLRAAISQLNDWSFEVHEDPLLEKDENDDLWEVNLDLVA